MKKILILFMAVLFAVPAFAADKTSADYLQKKRHLSPMNPIVESVAEKAIKKSLKKETGAKFNVKFEGYTLSSMKAGVFKNLVIKGKNVTVEDVFLPYLEFKTVTDYNWIDYTQNPVMAKSDMVFEYNIGLSEKSINDALKSKEYQKTIEKINKKAFPLFVLSDARVRIKDNRLYVIISYNFPINPAKKDRTLVVSTDFSVENGLIRAKNVGLNSVYGNLPIDKVTNLINLLDPLTFTLDVMNSKKCTSRIENVKLVDNIFQINGKMFVEGSK